MASDNPEDAPEVAKTSAEDRKAVSALASLNDDASPQARGDVDQAAVSAAMKKLGGGAGGKGEISLPIRKNVKIDQADVSLLVGCPFGLRWVGVARRMGGLTKADRPAGSVKNEGDRAVESA